MGLHAGTSGWAYGSWKPGFYPAGTGSKGFLRYYASKFNSVEVNFTFERPLGLTPEVSQRWLADVPEGFLFSFKAPRAVTHAKARLQDSEVLRGFIESLEPFRKAKRLGVVLFQLPPTLKSDAGLLKSFLKKWPKKYRAAFEFRHGSWFNEEVFTILRKAGVALCVAESDELETPNVATAGHIYYRLRLSKYSKAALEERARRMAKHIEERREVFAYLKHEDSPISTVRAKRLVASVSKLLGDRD
jgi:uncharacterized protein YecE (DUF72 family)